MAWLLTSTRLEGVGQADDVDEGLHGNGSRFETAVQNVTGSTLLRHERHLMDTSVASRASKTGGGVRAASKDVQGSTFTVQVRGLEHPRSHVRVNRRVRLSRASVLNVVLCVTIVGQVPVTWTALD